MSSAWTAPIEASQVLLVGWRLPTCALESGLYMVVEKVNHDPGRVIHALPTFIALLLSPTTGFASGCFIWGYKLWPCSPLHAELGEKNLH